jgi:hypothetical protein
MKEANMAKAVARSFSEVVRDRVGHDPAFKADLLQEAAQCLLSGELEIARNLVGEVIKGSIGYPELARRIGSDANPKSLIRMFGPKGNPTAANLSVVFVHLQRAGGVKLYVRSISVPRKRSTKRAGAVANRVA